MSSRRAPAAPPTLPGYRFVSVLGSGGFSDVYLYAQDRPRRKVAVKVLTADLMTEGARASFESEANLMAQLSAHPYIVTIFEAEITDSGHSYLAMEYCSRPSLDMQYRQGRFSADKALEIGIQVASAVETAHRAGIAHRDIKPANILVTDYNRPALTDFGISGTTDSIQSGGGGMSIPWSPPESFGPGATDGVKVDIWALAATIYTLLAGHSPFVIPGADNSQRNLMDRIAAAPLPRLGRADVPEALELVLATAMAKPPSSRYGSAKDFARALMRVQADMNLSVTPFEVQEEAPSHEVPAENSEATRVRSIISIDPDAATSNPTFPTRPLRGGPAAITGTTGSTGSTTGLTRNGQTIPGPALLRQAPPPPAHEFVLDSTIARNDLPGDAVQAPAAPAHPQRKWLGLVSGLVLAAAVVVGAMVFINVGAPHKSDPGDVAQSAPATALVIGAEVPAVTGLSATPMNGGSEWTWTNPDPQDGDKYVWAAVSAVDSGEFKPITEARVFAVNGSNDQSCIAVKLVRKNGQTSQESKKCS
ncbi:serine/threonine-protein kinase [Arthrobacter sp. LAPM80]|uniref:serine/threonine-protein kinase n=1 Tax=Arthrobacter sp. LAPM80 TaxID=3141788 RepID=UPI00398B3A14